MVEKDINVSNPFHLLDYDETEEPGDWFVTPGVYGSPYQYHKPFHKSEESAESFLEELLNSFHMLAKNDPQGVETLLNTLEKNSKMDRSLNYYNALDALDDSRDIAEADDVIAYIGQQEYLIKSRHGSPVAFLPCKPDRIVANYVRTGSDGRTEFLSKVLHIKED